MMYERQCLKPTFAQDTFYCFDLSFLFASRFFPSHHFDAYKLTPKASCLFFLTTALNTYALDVFPILNYVRKN